MSDIGEVVHLSDLVADLKARVEALERELASMKPTPAPQHDIYAEQGRQAVLAGKWDQGHYSEEDFRG